ncbi:MAG: indole-3-glycerol phosphate synthase TrpC [Candidatus Omnitrophica bacterium]|nr:indole-3-glycerol phosphate synthase TrpC [Candidatus Omnitrophota bacterium]
MILSKIIQEKKKHVELAKIHLRLAEICESLEKIYRRSFFKKSISRAFRVNLIAEMKRSSPSRGIIRGNFNPVQIALTFQSQGVSAISVVTDERFFDGKLEYIREIKERVSIPVLRNDFIIDEYQIYESAYWGADAVVLIADILTESELVSFRKTAKHVGMDIVCEVHTDEDIVKAVNAGMDIICINNRDLHDFRVDLGKSERLVKQIPENIVKVSASGINTYEDMMFLKSLGFNATLTGEVFMDAEDIGAKVRELLR